MDARDSFTIEEQNFFNFDRADVTGEWETKGRDGRLECTCKLHLVC